MNARVSTTRRHDPRLVAVLSVVPAAAIFLVLSFVLHGHSALAMQFAFG